MKGITKYVSLGSIIGATVGGSSITVLAILSKCGIEEVPNIPLVYMTYGIIGSLVTVILHKENIKRLINGDESKLGEKT